MGCKIIEKKRNNTTISGKYRLFLQREKFRNKKSAICRSACPFDAKQNKCG